jgi:thiosulfate reductase cytochrome b subunit
MNNKTAIWIYRHSLPVRLMHWINVLCLTILVMSGLQIFNAHPSLYWGERSDPGKALLSLKAMRDEGGKLIGVTRLLDYAYDTTGILGASIDGTGQIRARGFPDWATLPGPQWLAMGRRWHLFFAWLFVVNGLLFVLYAIISRHLANDLIPWWKDLRGIGRSVLDHLLFRHSKGEAARRYNVLQKITYILVIFGLGPLIVLTGLSMSPMLNAAFPELLTLFDGRQSARTVHFITAFAFIGFVLIHVFMVLISGVWNNLRSMITGWYTVRS